MQILKRGNIVYYVKDEAVIAGINGLQYLSFTVYPLQNRKPFYDFRRTLLKSKEDEYANAIELLRLGQRFNLKATASHKPKEEPNA